MTPTGQRRVGPGNEWHARESAEHPPLERLTEAAWLALLRPIGEALRGWARFIPPGGPSRPWHLIRFRHVIDGSLALASLNLACRIMSGVSEPLTTIAFDGSSLRGLRQEPDCRSRKGPPSSLIQLRAAVLRRRS